MIYARTPVPAKITKSTKIRRIIAGSILKYAPNPPHTPAIFLFVADFSMLETTLRGA